MDAASCNGRVASDHISKMGGFGATYKGAEENEDAVEICAFKKQRTDWL